LVRATGS